MRAAIDSLSGYCLDQLTIDEEQVVATSGEAVHAIARRTDLPGLNVLRKVFAITHEELARADGYEAEAYQPREVTLASGRKAWAYVQAGE